jgi:hypothetical protein
MRARPHEYGIYFFTDGEFASFLSNMRKSRTWGDEFTLRAAADAFNCNVHVLTSDNSNWHLCYDGRATPAAPETPAAPTTAKSRSASAGETRAAPTTAAAEAPASDIPKRKLFLTYIAPVHYNCVRREDLPSLEAALP